MSFLELINLPWERTIYNFAEVNWIEKLFGILVIHKTQFSRSLLHTTEGRFELFLCKICSAPVNDHTSERAESCKPVFLLKSTLQTSAATLEF